MQPKRLTALIITFVLLFSLVSCDQLHPGKQEPDQDDQGVNGDVTPSEDEPATDDSSNGNSSGEEESKIIFVYSVVRKVIHREDCASVALINKEYREEVEGDITGLLLDGYRLCSICFPVEDDEDAQDPEEDENKVAKEDATFVLNASNMKIHMLDCRHVKTMSEKNIEYTDLSLEELLTLKYIPCGTCLPDEYAEYRGN